MFSLFVSLATFVSCLDIKYKNDIHKTYAPTWPTMLKPVGKSSCSASGSMALIMSSDIHEQILD